MNDAPEDNLIILDFELMQRRKSTLQAFVKINDSKGRAGGRHAGPRRMRDDSINSVADGLGPN